MSKKILVTGGTGFLGAYILQELITKGYTVRAILREGSRLPSFVPTSILEKVEWVKGDILDVISLEENMQGMDAIIHAAAVVSFSSKHKKELYQVNVEGTANVVNMALEAGIDRLVYISSVAALGRTIDGSAVDESKKWENNKTNTHYAKSKHKAELEVWRAMGEGLNAVILNPSTILGYGNWEQGSSAIFRNVYRGFNWYSPGLNGFVDVKDVARATVLLMESDATEERFIVNADNWSFKKLLDTIAENFNVKKPRRQTTPFLAGIAWRLARLKSVFDGHTPLLTRESVRVAHSHTRFENKKIKEQLPGFEFTPLERSIAEAAQKYLAGHSPQR